MSEQLQLQREEKSAETERADWLIPSGVFVVTLKTGQKANAYTAAWVVRVSEEPVMVQAAVWEQNYSYTLAQDCTHFAVHILSNGQQDTALHFGRQSGRDVDKLQGYPSHPGVSGIPILDDCLAYLECEVVFRHRFGDHIVLVGRAVDSRINREGGRALIYNHRDYAEQGIDIDEN